MGLANLMKFTVQETTDGIEYTIMEMHVSSDALEIRQIDPAKLADVIVDFLNEYGGLALQLDYPHHDIKCSHAVVKRGPSTYREELDQMFDRWKKTREMEG